ncbi:HNH endonuclease signature motif containing protein [Paenibacillus sp. DR312]|uniref:HNH endonuclease signature motif containing protein n=1 Tax=unclassified Paenibacillus TaxID=185978 RepID=UPI001C94A8A6|nr:HNH endonuclease signature motif containing protein [Paenibacillus sp. DR312]QZN78022.1 HNH endonuclease [Paenibacillus sp. DR312]
MRIHGELVLARRKEFSIENNYSNYREILLQDFQNICGYCGKDIHLAKKGFEIDHFCPVSTDNSKENDYNNLVLSCFTCNRKKSKKWPTKNKDLCHDGVEGFVDPTTQEYDTHIGRDINGIIEHYTDLGRYMHGVFKFRLRPTGEIWKSMELMKRKKYLYKIKESSNLSKEQKDLFIEIQEELDSLLDYLLGKGE